MCSANCRSQLLVLLRSHSRENKSSRTAMAATKAKPTRTPEQRCSLNGRWCLITQHWFLFMGHDYSLNSLFCCFSFSVRHLTGNPSHGILSLQTSSGSYEDFREENHEVWQSWKREVFKVHLLLTSPRSKNPEKLSTTHQIISIIFFLIASFFKHLAIH